MPRSTSGLQSYCQKLKSVGICVRTRLLLETDVCHGVTHQGRMFTSVHLHGIEAGVAGLAGDGGSVGAVAGALGDKPSAERVPAQFAQCGGVVAGLFGAATDGLVDCCSGQRGAAEVPVLGDGAKQRRASGGAIRARGAIQR